MAEIDHVLPDGSFLNELDTSPLTLDHVSPMGSWAEESYAGVISSEIRPFVWVDT